MFLEDFRTVAQWSNKQLINYMNINNAWDMLADDDLIEGLMGQDVEALVETIGGYLPRDEQLNIISRYNRRFHHKQSSIQRKVI